MISAKEAKLKSTQNKNNPISIDIIKQIEKEINDRIEKGYMCAHINASKLFHYDNSTCKKTIEYLKSLGYDARIDEWNQDTIGSDFYDSLDISWE